MRARFINEKFSEETTDPVHDMGIGEVEYERLQRAYKQLEKYMQFDMEDIEFADVIRTLDYLRRISAYNVSSYFNRIYTFGIRIDPKNAMGDKFATGTIGENYKIEFFTSGPGKMVYISIADKYGDLIPIRTIQRENWQQDTRYAEGVSRTLHGLHAKFLYFCKLLKIDLTSYRQNKTLT